jgi:hypothetical protein
MTVSPTCQMERTTDGIATGVGKTRGHPRRAQLVVSAKNLRGYGAPGLCVGYLAPALSGEQAVRENGFARVVPGTPVARPRIGNRKRAVIPRFLYGRQTSAQAAIADVPDRS